MRARREAGEGPGELPTAAPAWLSSDPISLGSSAACIAMDTGAPQLKRRRRVGRVARSSRVVLVSIVAALLLGAAFGCGDRDQPPRPESARSAFPRSPRRLPMLFLQPPASVCAVCRWILTNYPVEPAYVSVCLPAC